MMREILFRAKAINRNSNRDYRTTYNNGDWVYGLLSSKPYDRFNIPAKFTNESGVSDIDIDYKTIGQYTGLCDKKGVKIFEGDIIIIDDNKKHPVICTFTEGAWECLMLSIPTYRHRLEYYLSDKYEIIGNIYDNPELLANRGGD